MKLQQMIQDRLSKLEILRLSVNSDRETPEEVRAQNKALIKELEEEISELQMRNSELEQLSHIEDNLYFLQVCDRSQNITNR